MAKVPLPDACADVVISNGAINLPDKACTLREAFRVLKLGGRLHIADMIRDESAPQCESVAGESWADCVGGTVTAGCFLQALAEIGFVRAECVKTTAYRTSASTIGALFFAQKPSRRKSVVITSWLPQYPFVLVTHCRSSWVLASIKQILAVRVN
jgi:arsenite methyltransferase